jgi:hypothetical protein
MSPGRLDPSRRPRDLAAPAPVRRDEGTAAAGAARPAGASLESPPLPASAVGAVAAASRFGRGSTPAEVGAIFGLLGRTSAAARAVQVGLLSMMLIAATYGGPAPRPVDARPLPAPVDARPLPPTSAVVLLGLNASASFEKAELEKQLGSGAISLIAPSRSQGVVQVDGQRFDLADSAARVRFGQALGLPAERAQALATALEGADPGARDELGELAKRLRETERGQRRLERLVISGHNTGHGPWGEGNGQVTWDALGQLTAVFPRAAAQVEDLNLAACYSGSEASIDRYLAIFPNLKTIWAYDGSAPGAASGAVTHLLRWERATRGSDESLTRRAAERTRKGENVVVWTRARGLDNGQPPASLSDVRERYEASRPSAERFFSGEQFVENPQTGPLRDHYNALQRLLARSDLPTAERPALESQRERVIRLLFWTNVIRGFASTHGATVNQALRELGLPSVDLGGLSREETLAAIEEFRQVTDGAPQTRALERARALLDGLRDLDPATIPAAWI